MAEMVTIKEILQKETKIVIWGTGMYGTEMLKRLQAYQIPVYGFCDNDANKWGKTFQELPILSPETLRKVQDTWEETEKVALLVILAVNTSILSQATLLGLKQIKTLSQCKKELVAFLAENMESTRTLGEKKDSFQAILKPFSSKEDFLDYRETRLALSQEYERELTTATQEVVGQVLKTSGHCHVCEKNTEFELNLRHIELSEDKMVAFRGRMVCTYCGFNNRFRFAIEYILETMSKESSIYITEQLSPLFSLLQKLYPHLTGSEYLDPTLEGGTIVDGIRHENCENLSFEDNTQDYVVTLDVFEHLNDYRKAFSEIYRVLSIGGEFLCTIPFFFQQDKTITRASIKDGKIHHLLPEIYHGNPLSADGALVFHDYGWDLLDILREIGFKQVEILSHYSIHYGYMGDNSIVFRGKK